ncbi:hypothetical protein [Pyxidicoccus trucidator]|uniref:hypothetical protein n=1 Tax=Pyxidicoccus trucidator TaxID=2709662 RepID=UPI003083F1C1
MATRLTVAVLLLALLNACASPRVVRLDTGQGSPLEYRPSSSNKSVKVDEEAFEEALARLVLEAPLTLRAPQQGLLVRASHPGNSADTRWQRLMRKSFGGLCRELKRATDRATTWIELEQASQRFANRVGPEVARVLVLAVTVVVSHGMTGGAAWLASRVPMLPSFTEAAMAGASRVGLRLENVGQVSAGSR